jgi:AcrR family transcriptional regulator
MNASRDPRGRRANLSRKRVLEAAVMLVERDGAGALTMRRLGDELGVEAMSIYNHVPSRDALLDGISELLMARLTGPRPGTPWRTACRDFAHDLRSVALDAPEAFQLIGLRPMSSAAALAPIERLLQCLVDAGARPPRALAIYRALASYARGYALAEATGFTIDASTPTGLVPLRTLREDEFPILRGRAGDLAALAPDDGFDLGLEALLDGLRDAVG